ncbi:hypothetical protein C0J52_03894 [Blattella germanica]|nr:hypothetical protein C0J52_03894 [Blattella germanica]
MSDATGSDVEDLPEDEIPVGGLPAIQEAPQGEGQVIPQGEEQAVPISDEQKPAANEEQAIPQDEEQAVPISDEQKPAANEEQAIPQSEEQAKPVSDEKEVPVGEIQEAPVKEGEVPEGEVLPEGEESLEGEEVEVVEEEEIPEFLDSDFFISKPILSEKCTLPEDFLIFDYSFGYDCKKFFNLALLEENVLVFYSGNILHIFNTKTKELWFRRSAVAETGDVPLIIIYEWPTFEIVAVLKEGTLKNPDGEMLCSQGGEPDYQITVWNWHASRIILRSQAYINDVFVCRFSPTVPGSITTSGVSHIKFWKMARTFTGLKLMGSLGRFGKTEMCNIIGFYSLPDGKLWFFDTIDGANPSEEFPYVELEPMFELKIEDDHSTASIMTMIKIYEEPKNQEYYCQDGNGGIWRYDIYSESNQRQPAEKLFVCHAGPVMDIATSPVDEHFASLGKDGRLFVDPSGSVLVAAFNDGCIRVLVISIAESKKPHPDGTEFVNLIQIIKAHDKAITIMSMNQKGTVLVTGSEEARIFVFNIKREINKKYIRLDPIGFVPVANSVTFLAWKPFTGTTLLVCCKGGEFVEMKIPEFVQRYTGVTYNLVEVETKTITFHKDSESEEELEPIFIPKEPNPILFGMYTPRNTIWISMAGYDAGFMYEYVMDKEEPVKCTPVKDAYEIPIHTFLYSHNRKYLILAMEDGRIRVNRVNQNDFTDLSDYWLYSMHDNFNGKIHRMCFNYDNHYMFTCGEDGSIFSYHVNFEDDKEYIKFWKKAEPHPLPTTERVEDIVDKTYLSLEGTKIKAEYDRKMALANLHKEKVLKELQKLKLPASQKFPMSVFEIHPDITEDLNKKLQDEVDLVKRKLAFDVEKSTLGLRKVQDYFINILETMSFFVIAIRKKIIATSFRLRRLPDEFEKAKEDPREPERKVPLMELFLKSIDKNSPEYKANKKLQRLIEKYLQRKSREEYRQRKWRKLWSKKPDVTKMHPSDLEAIQEAEETIGDFKLKSAQDYKVPKHLRISTVNKYDELLKARERVSTNMTLLLYLFGL